MELKNLKYDVEGDIGILTVNRPKAMNALNRETVDEITQSVNQIKEEGNTRVLILTGEGEKAFVAGADISEFREVGLKEGFDFSRRLQAMNDNIEKMGIPVIAMLNGLALGGGCELALACTLRIISENAKMGFQYL